MKAIEWWIPEDQRRKRRPYKMGVKRFLISLEVGERKPLNEEELRYGSLRSVASRLFADYGCKFSFKKVNGGKNGRKITIMEIRHNYEVRWYQFNLTERRSRKFFTEIGARLFAWYVETFEGAITKIYDI